MKKRKSLFTIDSFIWTLVIMSQSVAATFAPANWKEKGFAAAYLMASKLTDPLCNAHRLYRQILLVDPLYPDASSLEKYVRKSLLLLGSTANSFFSLFTTLPGIEIRLLANALEKKPYIYFAGDAQETKLNNQELSLLSWNICCVSAGYSITDAGVVPWPARMDKLIMAIRSQDADVICLYEIFDIQAAFRLFAGLKDRYSHFFFNIGPNCIGLSSGLFVASKAKIANPEFVAFPQESFDGRGKHCRKGFFSFDVLNDKEGHARIFSTHLQHSEIPISPTPGEVAARKSEMELIVKHMQKANDKVCVLTGDLNLEERELFSSGWAKRFELAKLESKGFSWGGDGFCSALMGKPISPSMNLDHTLVLRKAGVALTVSFVETGFDGAVFNPAAISDHKGLLSIITFGNEAFLQKN